MSILAFDWPDMPRGVRAISTTRAGGISLPPFDDGVHGGGLNLGTHVGDVVAAVQHNRERLRTLLPSDPVWLTQVHGHDVIDAGQVDGVPQADASVTDLSGVVCAILTADCLPVLLCDVAGTVVGAVHAGWRGLAGGVLQNSVAALHKKGAGEILAWLGPAIGPQQFEVGSEVVGAFVAGNPLAATAFTARPGIAGKYLADLYQLARLVLAGQGVLRVAGGSHCTMTGRGQFYSFRRDGQTGRMASLIWLER
ncbi:peptidoglycan editing factor PgeF [Actimicrobium sp. CCC2.4]|uniref:peptidoglycan editing factor PgeF n=1 Tax=Actimicrobium sp. CCC2.4 TaxID=3048606 RepID=UPI002AC9468A|nr:peptidoglycan editing factor PgeF [Actimicrobium sp. CCC2.4]MEB0134857.1 peptidoglycan editing factor PgeF [Actimicrobium sp. CCC2.4]WPX30789.1 peptidoglycan editing factor PgeF [Actimicrobium sp. CCC2.4]